MATLSAAELQRKHELEGAPDPFPSLEINEDDNTKRLSNTTPASLDTESHSAFPSLAAAAPPTRPAAGVWSAASVPRIKGALSRSNLVCDSFSLSAIDLSHAGNNGKSGTLSEAMKNSMSKFKVKVEASTQRRTGQTTFFIKGDSERDIEKARRHLVALLSPVVTVIVNAPASTISLIIGPKGATLKHIRDQTGVRIDIPRKDGFISNVVIGNVSGISLPTTRSGTPLPGSVVDGSKNEPMVPVTVNGPAPLVEEARLHLSAIIASKTSKTTQRVRDIPKYLFPFFLSRKVEFEAAVRGEELHLNYSEKDGEVIVNGDREAVGHVIEIVKTTIEELKSCLKFVSTQLPRSQHRLLAGHGSKEIFHKSQCVVVVPTTEDIGEEVKIWGLPKDLSSGLQVVMERANSQHIHEYTLPGPLSLSRQILTYITRTSYAKTLTAEHSALAIYLPAFSQADKHGNLNIDFVGDKVAVDAAVKKLSELIGTLIGCIRDVEVDWILHRIIQGKSAKRIKQFHEFHNVLIYFPPESAETSTVVLVYDPQSTAPSLLPAEKAKHLDEVEKELQKLVKDAADIKTQTLQVDKKWHEAIVGEGRTTLNAIVGEDKTLSIKFGYEANKVVNSDAMDDDIILIRGASADVDRATKEILRIVEDAKNNEINNSYSVAFDITREYVGRIVGSNGAQVRKLREQLGVKLDFSDEVDEKEKESKKRKAIIQKSKVTITGRRENVEEAKRRILGQVEKFSDETSESLRIPRQYHSSLIGQSGKYVLRLEDKYSVKITFPRDSVDQVDNKSREVLKVDEVLIKGGKRGVAGAKSEILEAVEFEKESNNSLTFTVPTRAIPRILGKGGSSINEIKDESNAQIDIDKAEDSGAVTNITVRGTKKAVATAKAAILAIADSFGDEATITVNVESKYHRALIGVGGQGLRELVAKCGGPEDIKLQAGLIHFPRQGDPSDEVRLRGERSLVIKLKAELEKTAAVLRNRVVLGVAVPASQHRAMIGRGGQNLQNLQEKTGAQVQFPGSRSYQQVGEPENASELKDVGPQDLVKVFGPRVAAQKALDELALQVRTLGPDAIKAVVEVPLKYHHVISQQGSFFRNLRSIGVNVDQSATPEKNALPSRPSTDIVPARIDDTYPEAHVDEVQWQVIPNYQDAEEGNSEWTLRARDQAGLDKAKKLIEEAIEHAQKASHVGFLTLGDRSVFPRIVGAKGGNVARLRAETGAEITVGREDNTITIIGAEAALAAAKVALLQIAQSKGRRA